MIEHRCPKCESKDLILFSQYYKGKTTHELKCKDCGYRDEVDKFIANIPVMPDKKLLISEGLLEDIRHTLVSIGGLKAFDMGSPHVVCHGKRGKSIPSKGLFHQGLYEIDDKKADVPFEELIDLDFKDLIEKIDEVLK